MPDIRPISDLRNHFAEISRTVKEEKKPVILTKNGYGDMVVMSYEQYEDMQYEVKELEELRAVLNASKTGKWIPIEEAIEAINTTFDEAMKEYVQAQDSGRSAKSA